MPEAVWARVGAVALVVRGCLPLTAALSAVVRGTDVHLFLAGIMLLAALARNEGLSESLAALAVRLTNGCASHLLLFALDPRSPEAPAAATAPRR